MSEVKPVPSVVEDMLGIKVVVGDRIAYAVTAGRSGDLVVGEVVGFQWSKAELNYSSPRHILKIKIKEEKRSTGYSSHTGRPVLIHADMKRFVKMEPVT